MTTTDDSAAQLLTAVRRALAEWNIAHREVRMFGGVSFMVNDKMVVAVRPEGMLVRVDEGRQPDYLTQVGVVQPTMGRTPDGIGRSMGPAWIEIDAVTLSQPSALRHWLDVGLEHNAEVTGVPRPQI